MADGTHWEWRSFDELPEATTRRITSLDKHFGPDDSGYSHTDDYLFATGRGANVKLRDGFLKFKRLLRREGEFEIWTEEAGDSFPFPLDDAAVEYLREQMSLEFVPSSSGWRQSPDDMIDSLPGFSPALQLVRVSKTRIQYDLLLGDENMIIELAEIRHPLRTHSLSIEGRDITDPATRQVDETLAARSLANMQKARAWLMLPPDLQARNYLQMLDAWTTTTD